MYRLFVMAIRVENFIAECILDLIIIDTTMWHSDRSTQTRWYNSLAIAHKYR